MTIRTNTLMGTGLAVLLLATPATQETIPEPSLLPQPLSTDSVNTGQPTHAPPLMAESNLLEG